MSAVFELLVATSRATAAPAGLSEAELLQRFPALAAAVAVLFLFGLVADICLVAWWIHRRRTGSGTAAELFHVPPRPWGLAELAIGTAILLAVVGGGNMLFALALQLLPAHSDYAFSWLLAGDMLVRLAMLAVADHFFRRQRVDWLSAVGLPGLLPTRAVAIGALLVLAALPPLTALFAATHALYALCGREPGPQPIAAMFVASESWTLPALIGGFALFVAPVFEEVFFRGFAYPAIKQRFGMAAGLIIVSAAFALVHFHGPSAVPLFALALGLGLAYELSGSLLAPITMHLLFNALNLAMLTFVRLHQ